MKVPKCDSCAWRAKFDTKPQSIIGRIWRWHVTWCPGWKKYMNSLSAENRASIAAQYNMQDRFGA